MLFRRKTNLSVLAEDVSRNLSAVTLDGIRVAVDGNPKKNPKSCFRIFLLSDLMTWSITSLMLENEEERQICLAICDQLPYRYAKLSMMDNLNEESIRILAEQCMSDLVQSAQEKNQSLMERLGFWVASNLKADAVSAIELQVHIVQKVTQNARIVATVRKKHRIIYDLEY